MEVVKKEFDFTYRRRTFRAHLSMFTPAKTLMLHIWLRLANNKEEAFVFYRKAPGELFWFDLHDEYLQGMAKTLANLLLDK